MPIGQSRAMKQYKWRELVANFGNIASDAPNCAICWPNFSTNASGAIWWPNLELIRHLQFGSPLLWYSSMPFSAESISINQRNHVQQIWKVANFMMESQDNMEFHNMMAFHHIMAVPYDGSRQFLNLVMFYWTFPQSFIFVIQSPELAQLTVREPGHAAFGPLSSHPSTGQENTSPVLIVILIHSTYQP